MPHWRTARFVLLVSPLLLSGCSYVHFGKLPPPPPPSLGEQKARKENDELRLEKKLLQQELALTRAEGTALRMAIENRTADGDTSKRLTERLTEATRELATLRENYAQLVSERDQAVAAVETSSAVIAARAEASDLRSRLGATEEQLAASLRTFTQLQEEVGKLRTEVARAKEDNAALNEQIQVALSQSTEDQAALAQLNIQLLTQKDARERAEQDVVALRTQLAAGGSALSQLRTAGAGEARTLGPETAEVIALKEQLDAYRSRVDSLESERIQLRQQVAALEARNTPALADVEARLATALSENTALATERTALQTELSALRSGAAPAADVQTLRDQLREAQSQITTLAEENSLLKHRLATGGTPVRIALSGDSTSASPTAPSAPAPLGEDPGTPAPSGLTTPPAQSSGVTATLITSAGGVTRTQTGLHVVTAGDTLAKISTRYYGAPDRWSEILAANRDVLGETNNLVIGRTLRIP